MGVSNKITAFLNFIAFLCSVAIIAAGVWFASKPDNECIRLFRWPVVLVGVFVLIVSLAGFVGAQWNKESLLVLYLFAMAILIVVLLVLLVFAFVVTRPDGSFSVPGRAYREYSLDRFSSWLRDRVTSSGNWNKIKTCLAESDVCVKLSQEYVTADQFFAAPISPLQSGCCKPPTVCGYTFVNPITWVNPVNQASDPDCYAWSNDPNQLCYGCNSCKAGLLGNLRDEWRKANVILIAAVVVLIVVYVIGCSAFKNAQTEELFRRYKRGWA
ncbi:tetraspanin-2 [Malania oleifera]|uniref:tetraspanin-2 n=1 Tax=Malania oleifera TaxID=397392 RepID=UPI0025ADFCD8|nr:tetraspanin-2 [Malania oleifera]